MSKVRYEELFSCESLAVVDAAVKCRSVFETHEHALVSVSGGATLTSWSTSASA